MSAIIFGNNDGNNEIVKILILLGANLYAKDDNGMSVLNYATYYENNEAHNMIMKAMNTKVKVDSKNNTIYTLEDIIKEAQDKLDEISKTLKLK